MVDSKRRSRGVCRSCQVSTRRRKGLGSARDEVLRSTPDFKEKIDDSAHAVTPGSVASCVERAGALAHACHASVALRFPTARCISSETWPQASANSPGSLNTFRGCPRSSLNRPGKLDLS